MQIKKAVAEDQSVTATTVEKEHNYKGDIVEISALVGKQNIVVEAIEVNVPQITSRWGRWGNAPQVVLPHLMIITNVYPSGYGEKMVQIHTLNYMKNFEVRTANVPKTFQVKVLHGTMKEKIYQKYAEYQFANLRTTLMHPSMTLGSIPEIFVDDEDGNVIPAFTFLGNSNKSKNQAYGNKPVYSQGFQAAFKTEPVSCLAYHVDSVQLGLEEVLRAAQANNKKAKLSLKSVVHVKDDVIKNTKKELLAFKDSQSLNVYGLQRKITPHNELQSRFSTGNIHFGYNRFVTGDSQDEHDYKTGEVVKALDSIFAVSCVSLFGAFDNPARRECCGLPGEYRLPQHRLEYRVLSNAWLIHPAIMNLVFDFGRKTLQFGYNNLRTHWDSSTAETIDIISSCDVAAARGVMERNKTVLTKLLQATYPGGESSNVALSVLMNGMDTILNDPNDMAKNWKISNGWMAHSEAPNCNWVHAYPNISAGQKI